MVAYVMFLCGVSGTGTCDTVVRDGVGLSAFLAALEEDGGAAGGNPNPGIPGVPRNSAIMSMSVAIKLWDAHTVLNIPVSTKHR